MHLQSKRIAHMLIGTALKFFLVVTFFADPSREVFYYGPFTDEEACYRWDYLVKDGAHYVGTCKLLDPATVPRSFT
jgi:hypothetical protein